MDWFSRLSGIPIDKSLDISIPKEKIVTNIKAGLIKKSILREMDNVRDIVYRNIFRGKDVPFCAFELHVIEVLLHEPKHVKAIAEAIHKAIPYSKVIVFSSGKKHLLFHANFDATEIFDYNFTDWVYEEELMADFSSGNARQITDQILENDWESWSELPSMLWDAFSEAGHSEFICIRHLVDLLKIREAQTESELVMPIITLLFAHDRLDYFGETPFVSMEDGNQLYSFWNEQKFGYSKILDERYGIDRRFEELGAADYTSAEEVQEILHEAERRTWLPESDECPAWLRKEDFIYYDEDPE